MPKHKSDPKIEEFLQKLTALDAGGKSRLKRDAGKSLAEAKSIGLFYRLLPYGLSTAQEEMFFLLATLYPLVESGGTNNFGASLHRARDPDPKKNKVWTVVSKSCLMLTSCSYHSVYVRQCVS